MAGMGGFMKYVWAGIEIYVVFLTLSITAPLVFHGINNLVAAFTGSSVAGLLSSTLLTLLYGVGILAIAYKVITAQIKSGKGGNY